MLIPGKLNREVALNAAVAVDVVVIVEVAEGDRTCHCRLISVLSLALFIAKEYLFLLKKVHWKKQLFNKSDCE